MKSWPASDATPSSGPWLAFLLFLILAQSAGACVEPDGANDTNYVNLATNYSSSLAFVDIYEQGAGYSSYASGIFLNSNWVLTAAHPVTDGNGNQIYHMDGVAQGSHLTASSTLNPISTNYIYPGFDNSGNTPDLMLVQLATPVSVPPTTIGSAYAGQIVTEVGFGEFGTPATGLQIDFQNNVMDARAWQAPVYSRTDSAYSSTYYQTTLFGPDESALNGRGAPGDSGGPSFNSFGELVGITEGGTTSLLEVGDTTYNMLAQPDEYAWIMNTITPVAAQILSVSPTNADVQVVWSGKGGSNYVVQATSALGGTNTFSDISGVIGLAGVGPVTTNFFDAGALTNFPARFYRVRTD